MFIVTQYVNNDVRKEFLIVIGYANPLSLLDPFSGLVVS